MTINISRRRLMAGAAGGAIFGVAASRSAKAAEFTYKLGLDQPGAHPQTIRTIEAAKNIAKESGGRLVVHVYPNSELGGDTQMLSQVRSGALELMEIGDNILGDLVPAASVASLPFAFSGYEQLWAAMDGEFGSYIHAEIEKTTGLHVFEKGWDAGFRDIFTTDRAVHTPADMKGLKLRVPEAPIQLAFFRALGAAPTPLNNDELYTAMQTHLVDGAEQPLISIESAKYYEVSKYISLTNHQPTSFEMVANGRAWARLPKDLQGILTRNLNKEALLERADIANGEGPLEKKLKSQGQTIITPKRAEFRDVIERAGLYAKWRKTYGVKPFDLLEKAVGNLV